MKNNILDKIRTSYEYKTIDLIKGINDYKEALTVVKYDAYYINLITNHLIDYNLCMVSDSVKAYIYSDNTKRHSKLIWNEELNLLINTL